MRKFRILLVVTIALAILPLAAFAGSKEKVEKACDLMAKEEYEQAYSLFQQVYENDYEYFYSLDADEKIDFLNNFADCWNKIFEKPYEKAMSLYEDRKYDEAASVFASLAQERFYDLRTGYKDSAKMEKKCRELAEKEEKYQYAISLKEAGRFEEAIGIFETIQDYRNSKNQIRICKYEIEYEKGKNYFLGKDYENAVLTFRDLCFEAGKYKDCYDMMFQSYYELGKSHQSNSVYEAASINFSSALDIIEELEVDENTKEKYSRDISDRIVECENTIAYQEANELLNHQSYYEAYAIFDSLRGFKDVDNILKKNEKLAAIEKVAHKTEELEVPGNLIQLRQDEDWLVLDYDQKTNRAFILRVDALEMANGPSDRYYYGDSVDWGKSNARYELNRFYQALPDYIKNCIPAVTLPVERNAVYGVESGALTEDHVFLLSADEADLYLRDSEFRCCDTKCYDIDEGYYETAVSWWLRTPGKDDQHEAYVSYYPGTVILEGTDVGSVKVGLRPAMYIDLVEINMIQILYEKAVALQKHNEYAKAAEIFAELPDYKDCNERLNRCLGIIDTTPTPVPTPAITSAPTPKPTDIPAKSEDKVVTASSREDFAVGNYVVFGTYPQTSEGTDNTPIEWLVLDRDAETNSALLISKYGLDSQPFEDPSSAGTDLYGVSVSLKGSTLTQWLEKSFLNIAFSNSEQNAILWEKQRRKKVFLLTEAEVQKYFDFEFQTYRDPRVITAPTDYAAARNAETNPDYKTEEGKDAGWWWVGSYGVDLSSGWADATSVITLTPNGFTVNSNPFHSGYTVRPALWVDLSTPVFDGESGQTESSADEAGMTGESMNGIRAATPSPFPALVPTATVAEMTSKILTVTSTPTSAPTPDPTPTALPAATPEPFIQLDSHSVGIVPKQVGSSSSIYSSSNKYDASMAVDGKEETCWQFSTKNDPLGKAHLIVDIGEAKPVNEMWIKNGFWKITDGKDQYTRNGRPKKITIEFMYRDENSYRDPVSVTLKDDQKRKDWQKVKLGYHENVISVCITVNSIYKGSKFKTDVAVSEVMFVLNSSAHEDEIAYTKLEPGNKGDDVLQMKLRLQELGYFTKGADISDNYNSTCKERVRNFQKKNGLKETGIADSETLAVLYSENAIGN